MCRQKIKICLTIAAFGFSGNALAFMDGKLDDWLVAQGSWTAHSDIGLGINEETDGLSSDFGGQGYDAERLMAFVDWKTNPNSPTLYAAIVTGLKPYKGDQDEVDLGGSNGWRPGDLGIYTGNNYNMDPDTLWDIDEGNIAWTNEDPGSHGNGVGELTSPDSVYGLRIPDRRDNADTRADYPGYTGSTPVTRDVIKGGDWYTRSRVVGDPLLPTSLVESTTANVTGTADVIYTRAKIKTGETISNFDINGSNRHYLIEMAISLTSLGWTQGQTTFNAALQWGMNCSNDWINGHGSWTNPNPDVGTGQPVPEPTALALMALGLIGVGYGRRRTQPNS